MPTRSIQAGLSAAVAFDRRSCRARRTPRRCGRAIEGVVTAEVTQAVRDSLVDGVQIKAADFIGLVDDQVVVAAARPGAGGGSRSSARLLDGGREMLTVLIGDERAPSRRAAALERLRERYPSVEIDVHEGGQPSIPCLLSAE